MPVSTSVSRVGGGVAGAQAMTNDRSRSGSDGFKARAPYRATLTVQTTPTTNIHSRWNGASGQAEERSVLQCAALERSGFCVSNELRWRLELRDLNGVSVPREQHV